MLLYFPPVLVEFDMNSPLLFPHTPVCSEVLLRRRRKMLWSFLEAYEKCLAYGTPSQSSERIKMPKRGGGELGFSKNLSTL